MPGPVVLIGPTAVGKTAIGTDLARMLERPFVDVDEVAEPIYERHGRPIVELMQRIERDGGVAAFRWFEPALAEAVAEIVDEHPTAVIAFGAGHSHFTDSTMFLRVTDVLGRAEAIVVLLRIGPDPVGSIAELRGRCERQRKMDWIYGDTDFIHDWVRSAQNRALAGHVIDVAAQTADAAARQIAALVSDDSDDDERRDPPDG